MNKFNKGQSMFEVVLALFIITMIIVAVVILSTNSITNSIFSRNKTLASRYSQEALEWLRSEREKDQSDFLLNVNSSDTFCLTSLTFANTGSCQNEDYINETNLIRELIISQSDLGGGKTTTDATVVTFWTDSKGLHEARATTNFSDTRDQ